MGWYSARLIHICLVDSKKPRRRNTQDRRVVIFRARDRKRAIQRALAIGRAAEVEYRNVLGQRVRWAFVEIETLDQLGRRLDGREVSSRLSSRIDAKPVSFHRKYRPERSRPESCGIV